MYLNYCVRNEVCGKTDCVIAYAQSIKCFKAIQNLLGDLKCMIVWQ